MELNNEIRSYGLYFIKDCTGSGRISKIMEYPSDIHAVRVFIEYTKTEEFKKFPLPKKIELKRVCLINQVTDAVLVNSVDRTVCNAVNAQEVFSIMLKKLEDEQ